MAAAAMGLVRGLLQRPQGTTGTTRRVCGTAVGVATGFLSAATVASASDGASCPAYPWSPQDGARGGHKVFMQHDCAACHSGLPYAGLADEAATTRGEVEAKAAEIVVVHDLVEAAPARRTSPSSPKCWKGCAAATCTAPRRSRRGWRCLLLSGCSFFSRT